MKRKTMILIRPSKVFEHHCSLSAHSEKIMLASEKWRYIIDIKNANDKLNWKAFTNRGKTHLIIKKNAMNLQCLAFLLTVYLLFLHSFLWIKSFYFKFSKVHTLQVETFASTSKGSTTCGAVASFQIKEILYVILISSKQ